MKYTVLWTSEAEQDLAACWLDAVVRDDITRAAQEIDRLLRHDPHSVGESRDEGKRVCFASPLGVLFQIRPEDRCVDVLHLWRFA